MSLVAIWVLPNVYCDFGDRFDRLRRHSPRLGPTNAAIVPVYKILILKDKMSL
jgi:hypothetical protein